MSGTVTPEFGSTNAEITVKLGLIPEYNVFQFITLCVVAYNKTLVILCALVHYLAEELEGREGRSIVFVDTFAIIEIRFA